jgi:hypothetical protein
MSGCRWFPDTQYSSGRQYRSGTFRVHTYRCNPPKYRYNPPMYRYNPPKYRYNPPMYRYNPPKYRYNPPRPQCE